MATGVGTHAIHAQDTSTLFRGSNTYNIALTDKNDVMSSERQPPQTTSDVPLPRRAAPPSPVPTTAA